MTLQLDFLRFTDWKNGFELEEFEQFLAEFDIHNPEFLTWIEQNTAPYLYFQLYALLVKNYHHQQQDINKILTFLVSQKTYSCTGFIRFIKEPQKKYPDILDLEKFEQALLQHLKHQDISSYFAEFESLFDAVCLHEFHFQKIPTYLCQHVTAQNTKLIEKLVLCSSWHNKDYGILDKLLGFSAQGHRYSFYYDFKNWAERSKDLSIKEKIATVIKFTLNFLLEDPTPYFYETYLKDLQLYQANTIEGYIDFCRYLPNPQTKALLNQLIENQSLHIAIRFEAVLVYFLTFQQQPTLKQQLTQQLLTLPLGQRWGSCSSNRGFVYDYNLFKQSDFFSLDEVLLALNNTQWCYNACQALYDYSDDIDTQQKIITAIIDAIVAMIQKMLKVNTDNYVNASPIGYLISVLKTYRLNTIQKQKLEATLIDGLKNSIAHFTKQRNLHKEIVGMIYVLGFNIPDEYANLLSSWAKLELSYQAKGFSKQQVWQYLIDAEVINADTQLDLDNPIFPNFLMNTNRLMYNSRDYESSFYKEIFEQYFPHKIKWINDEEDIENIPTEQLIYINRENLELEWKSTEHFYFKYNEKYYTFFIYSFWEDSPSLIFVFNQILALFNINKAVYQLKDTDGYDDYQVFFSANPEKFAQINPVLGIECIESVFFTPQAKTAEFLAIETEYKKIIHDGGFMSGLHQAFIVIPKPASMASKQTQQWLISMIYEMRSQALVHLNQDDFCQQAINIRNLFISLALNMIGDYCVAYHLKKEIPLWQNTRYVSQSLAILDTIFNQQDLELHLKYPV